MLGKYPKTPFGTKCIFVTCGIQDVVGEMVILWNEEDGLKNYILELFVVDGLNNNRTLKNV